MLQLARRGIQARHPRDHDLPLPRALGRRSRHHLPHKGSEIENYRRTKDPLTLIHDTLVAEGVLTEDLAKEIDTAARAEADRAAEFAEASPFPATEDILKDVYWEEDNPLQKKSRGRIVLRLIRPAPPHFRLHSRMPLITYREALKQALAEELERDPNVVLMGEEVGQFHGAYKVTEGLLERFGPKRVIDTPISEAGFVGLGVGAAMLGVRPVIELMFWSFYSVAFDQILNNAANIRYMSGGLINIPIVIRGPANGGTNVGATHSHTPDNVLANHPGVKVVCPATAYDAKGLLKSAIRDNDPVMFLENTILYNDKGEVPAGEYLIPLGQADVKRAGHRPHHRRTRPGGHQFAQGGPDCSRPNTTSPWRSSTCAPSARSTRTPSSPQCGKPTACCWSRRTSPSAASAPSSPI